MCYEELINEALDFSKNKKATLLFKDATSFLIKIEHKKAYVIKGSQKGFSVAERQRKISSKLLDEKYNLGQIIYIVRRDIDSVIYTIEVQEFVAGKPISLDLNRVEELNVISAVFHLHSRLSQINTLPYERQLITVNEFFPKVVKHGKDSKFKKYGMLLLNDSYFLELMNQESQCIIYGDVWYKNILIDEKGKIGFIDLDPLLIGPPELQFSLLLSSFFIYIYLQKDNIKNFSLKRLVNLWPAHIEIEKVKSLLYVYPVLLGIMKTDELSITQDESRKFLLIQSIEVLSDILKVVDTIFTV
jgi:thiamine kinase-like enzyme